MTAIDTKMSMDPQQAEFLLQAILSQSIPSTPFSELARRWLRLYCQGRVKDNTYRGNYLEPVELHLIPYFGEQPVNDIKPLDVAEYFKSKGKILALETLKKHKVCLNGIFVTAVENGLCVRNPVTSTLKLSSKIPPKDKHAWTPEQYAVAHDFALRSGSVDILVLLETAISRSELLGLTWTDFDPQSRILHLNNGLVQLKNSETDKIELVHDGLKNEYRHRDIPISKELTVCLSFLPHVIYVGGDKRRSTPARRVETTYIFHAPHGGPYSPTNWYHRSFLPYMKALCEEHPEIPPLSPHELRHTRASVLNDQGVSLYDLQKLMGHSSLRMLSKRYLHSDTEQLRRGLGLGDAAFPNMGAAG